MPITIEDGRGSGISVGVNADHRLLAKSITTDELVAGTVTGISYVADIGSTVLTSAGESGIFYIKNNDPENYIQLYGVAVSIGKSNTTGDVLLKCYPNPTGGTLLTSGTSITPTNRNFGLTSPAQATAFGGAEGKTITGSSAVETFIFQTPQITIVDYSIVLPNGYSLAFSITPPASNTSMRVNLTTRIVYVDPATF